MATSTFESEIVLNDKAVDILAANLLKDKVIERLVVMVYFDLTKKGKTYIIEQI